MLFIINYPNPLPSDPPYTIAFYEAIGRLVLTWGRLEQHVDNLERMALNIAARTAPEKDMMVSLSRKLDRINELYRDCPDLSHNYAPIKQIIHELRVHGIDRHTIIHGNFQGFSDGPPPKIILRHVTHKGDMKVDRLEIPLETINNFISELGDVHKRLFSILQDTSLHQDPEKVREDLGLIDEMDKANPFPIPL